MNAFLTMLSMGGTFPAAKFFEPNQKFLDWVQNNHRNRQIYDVGAGVGHVSRAMNLVGAQVTALDVMRREEPEYDVLIGNGWIYPYRPGSVVLLARPCHGIFAEEAINQALRCKVHSIWYVGLDQNLERDLGERAPLFRRKATNVGADGEHLWKLTCRGLR